MRARSPWFASLSPNQRESIAAKAVKRKLKAGASVVRRGDQAEELFIVQSGRVKAAVINVTGRGTTFDILGPNDLFGEVGMFGGGLRTADVTALEACEVLVLRRAELLGCIRDDPTIAVALLCCLAERVKTLSDAIEDASALDAGVRFARSIAKLAERFGVTPAPGNLRIELRLSQQELAELVGVSRVFANGKLRGWQRAGILTHRSGKLTVHDVPALERAAGLRD
jgi:CRP-like cAMP-binding protein